MKFLDYLKKYQYLKEIELISREWWDGESATEYIKIGNNLSEDCQYRLKINGGKS